MTPLSAIVPKAIALFAIGLLAVTPVLARGGIQDPSRIKRAVRGELESRLAKLPGRHEIRIARIDPRLRLPACQVPLRVVLPTTRPPIGKLNLRVVCEGPAQRKPWRIYVGARVAEYRRVLVSRAYLARNESLREHDLVNEERDVSMLPRGYYQHADDVVGMVVKRPIPAGRIINPDMIRPPLLVRRGESVSIVARRDGLSVRMAGKALGDGALGSTVRVRNTRSRRIVEGRVSGERQITIDI